MTGQFWGVLNYTGEVMVIVNIVTTAWSTTCEASLKTLTETCIACMRLIYSDLPMWLNIFNCEIIRGCNNHWGYYVRHIRARNPYGSTQGTSYQGSDLVPRWNICIIWLCVPITLETRELWTQVGCVRDTSYWMVNHTRNIPTLSCISYHMNSLDILPHDGE